MATTKKKGPGPRAGGARAGGARAGARRPDGPRADGARAGASAAKRPSAVQWVDPEEIRQREQRAADARAAAKQPSAKWVDPKKILQREQRAADGARAAAGPDPEATRPDPEAAQPVDPRTRSALLRFVDRERVPPAPRDPAARARDFDEIYEEYDPAAAASQAARCSQCGVPFCQSHCPLENNIPDWLMLASQGRLREAYLAAQETNTFPEICGRICPQDRLCEGACVIEQAGHGTVTIGAVERHLVDLAFERGWTEPIRVGAARPESVGIVGAGPAGLSAAEILRRAGVRVAVYDRHDRAGGLLMYGIPNFKLDKAVVSRRVRRLEAAGVEFRLEVDVGAPGHPDLEALRARHDAVLLATGACRARGLEAPGFSLPGVERAMDYLVASNRAGLGAPPPEFADGRLDARGRRVVVVGGGDTAMDCVRTAVRQGAESVVCAYRRDRESMPGSLREVRSAEEEGVRFEFMSAPAAVAGAERAEAVRARPTERSGAGPDGRASFAPAPGARTRRLPADLVLLALGFDPEPAGETLGAGAEAPRLDARGAVEVERPSGATSVDGVFAAGDLARGASLVVWAIRDGRDAAAGILERLNAAAGARLAGARPAARARAGAGR